MKRWRTDGNIKTRLPALSKSQWEEASLEADFYTRSWHKKWPASKCRLWVMAVSVHVADRWALTPPVNSDMCVRRWRTAGRKISCCLNKRDQRDAGVERRREEEDEGGWHTSGSDTLTMLICWWRGEMDEIKLMHTEWAPGAVLNCRTQDGATTQRHRRIQWKWLAPFSRSGTMWNETASSVLLPVPHRGKCGMQGMPQLCGSALKASRPKQEGLFSDCQTKRCWTDSESVRRHSWSTRLQAEWVFGLGCNTFSRCSATWL